MKKKSTILLGLVLFTLIFSGIPIIIENNPRATQESDSNELVEDLKTSEWNPGFNYTMIDNFPYSWIELTGSGGGTNITSSFDYLDDGSTGISFSEQGWNFTFYGTEYDTINVTTNGYLSFSGQGDLDEWSTYPIPQDCTISTYDHHNDTVFLFHTDLNLDPSSDYGGGSVFYEFKGSAPNRYLVIEYFQVNNWSYDWSHLVGDFEAIFYENGDIKFQYKLVRDLFWYNLCPPQVGLDHGDLIHYSNYTNDWNKTFGGTVNELAVYFRLNLLPSGGGGGGDDDDDDDEEAVVLGFDLYFILLSSLLGLVIIAKKFKKRF